MPDPSPKPTLALEKPATLEEILALFRHLTGREPTTQEQEEARREWARQQRQGTTTP